MKKTTKAQGRSYAKAATYEAEPQQVANREARNRARYQAKKANPQLPRSTEVDHMVALTHGGATGAANTRLVSRHTNRTKAAKSIRKR